MSVLCPRGHGHLCLAGAQTGSARLCAKPIPYNSSADPHDSLEWQGLVSSFSYRWGNWDLGSWNGSPSCLLLSHHPGLDMGMWPKSGHWNLWDFSLSPGKNVWLGAAG